MLEQRENEDSNIQDKHITDAIMTYLSDVAMILATNDHRGKIIKEPTRTAECYNRERDNFLTFLNGKVNEEAITALMPPQKSKNDVLKEVKSLVGSFLLSSFTKSKSDNKTKQNNNQITTIQTEVLNDYNLEPNDIGDETPNIFEALDEGGNWDSSRNTALEVLTNRCNEIDEDDGEYEILNPVREQINNNNLPPIITKQILNIITWALGAKVRIIQPNGKIIYKGYQNNPVITLLQVDKPNPHYRLGVNIFPIGF